LLVPLPVHVTVPLSTVDEPAFAPALAPEVIEAFRWAGAVAGVVEVVPDESSVLLVPVLLLPLELTFVPAASPAGWVPPATVVAGFAAKLRPSEAIVNVAVVAITAMHVTKPETNRCLDLSFH
jgi:hypothetical protein